MSDLNEDPPETEPRPSLLDALLYAPIGLLLDGRDFTPELAKRGRQHAVAARQIGEMTVKTILRRLDESAESEDAQSHTEDDVPSSSHLAIADYDLIPASEVVKKLGALSEDELEHVRVYESATRDRRTILHKIARLQS